VTKTEDQKRLDAAKKDIDAITIAVGKDSKKSKKRENSIDRNLSCEEVDSDELDGDLNLSDSDDGGRKRADFKSIRQT